MRKVEDKAPILLAVIREEDTQQTKAYQFFSPAEDFEFFDREIIDQDLR